MSGKLFPRLWIAQSSKLTYSTSHANAIYKLNILIIIGDFVYVSF